MNSALASLTACYTDSENEDHHDEDDDDFSHSDPEEKQIQGDLVHRKTETISKPSNNHHNPKKSLRLVSYNDNEELHDDDEHRSEEEGEESKEEIDEAAAIDSEDRNKRFAKKYGFSLPPEPKSRPNPKLQENVTKISQKMIQNPNYDLNQFVQDNKSFRNPSIYDKLIQHCGINELGTNFLPDHWDPLSYGPESYYEELAKAQKSEMDKHEKQKKENIKTEVIVKEGKRKSKWDVQAQSSDGKLVQSSSSAGKTTTVINAFGTLKKPKV
jgi:hypothetical protein